MVPSSSETPFGWYHSFLVGMVILIMEDKMDDVFPKVSRNHSYEEFAKKLDNMSLEDLRKLMELGDHEYTYIENPNIDKVTAYTDEYGVRLGMFIDDKDKGRRR